MIIRRMVVILNIIVAGISTSTFIDTANPREAGVAVMAGLFAIILSIPTIEIKK